MMSSLSEKKQDGFQEKDMIDSSPDQISGDRPWTREEATAWYKEMKAAAMEAYKQVIGEYPKI